MSFSIKDTTPNYRYEAIRDCCAERHLFFLHKLFMTTIGMFENMRRHVLTQSLNVIQSVNSVTKRGHTNLHKLSYVYDIFYSCTITAYIWLICNG